MQIVVSQNSGSVSNLSTCPQFELLQGRDGRDGRDGMPGATGPQGPPGERGDPGGPQGPRGLTGSTGCLLYTSPSPRDATLSRMPSSA